MVLYVIGVIFSIIGIILGGAAALVLLLSAIILFAPFRYEVWAEKAPDGGPMRITFKLRWFLGFLRVDYNDKKLRMVVFWFYRFGKRRLVKRKNNVKKKKDKDTGDKVKINAAGVFAGAKALLAQPDKAGIWESVVKLIKRSARALKPKKCEIKAVAGLDNPADTGWLLGVLGIITGIWGIPPAVTGDFNGKVFTFDVHVKDSFMLWPLCKAFLMFCVSKPVWKLIRKYIFKKDDENEPAIKSKLRSAASEH
ncbi:MAG: hypothetical protein FWE91_11365 [Defluviitaleaceae bacterium]|nr:hypothetical protein [Defluviitaleaceae bacterium]MCL2837364.1 hypothetical protein [Defluviitaleaceae bacterium]